MGLLKWRRSIQTSLVNLSRGFSESYKGTFEKRRSCVGLQLWPLRCSKLWRICNKDIAFARVVKGLEWKRKKGNTREIEIRNGFPGDTKPSFFFFFFLFCHHHNHQFSCLKIWRFAANWHVVKNIDGVATSTPPCEYLELMKEIIPLSKIFDFEPTGIICWNNYYYNV